LFKAKLKNLFRTSLVDNTSGVTPKSNRKWASFLSQWQYCFV